jgi:hypothetical protein
MDDDATLRREFAEEMKQHSASPQVRAARIERLEDFLQRMQERGEITLRRWHDGRAILIWERR